MTAEATHLRDAILGSPLFEVAAAVVDAARAQPPVRATLAPSTATLYHEIDRVDLRWTVDLGRFGLKPFADTDRTVSGRVTVPALSDLLERPLADSIWSDIVEPGSGLDGALLFDDPGTNLATVVTADTQGVGAEAVLLIPAMRPVSLGYSLAAHVDRMVVWAGIAGWERLEVPAFDGHPLRDRSAYYHELLFADLRL